MLKTSLPEPLLVYLDELEAAGRSPLTTARYKEAIGKFIARLSCPLESATALDVRDYLDSRKAINTKANTLVYLRQYYQWMLRRGLAKADPTQGIPIPRFQRRMWPPIPAGDLETVLSRLDTGARVLVAILDGVGSRLRETCQIRTEHVVFDGDYGVIDFPNRKGGEVGYAVFGPKVTVFLRPWTIGRVGWLFPSRSGPVSHKWIEAKLRRASQGLTVPITAHRLRHAFITRSVEQGWPQLALQKQVGHRNPNSTAWYYHPTREGLLKVVRGLGTRNS